MLSKRALILSAIFAAAASADAADMGRSARVEEMVESAGMEAFSGAAFKADLSMDASADAAIVNGTLSDAVEALEVKTAQGWQEIEVKKFKNGRFWAKIALPAGMQNLELRAVGGDRSSMQVNEIETFNSADLPAAVTYDGKPVPNPVFDFPVVGRKEWKAAKPSYSFYKMSYPDKITVHHTAGNQPDTPAAAVIEMQLIQQMHKSRGFGDVGYHFLIAPDGTIYEGRPIQALGCHVQYGNGANVGISVMGNYNLKTPTSAALASLHKLLLALMRNYNIGSDKIYGHRQFNYTECPGEVLFKILSSSKERLAYELAFGTEKMPMMQPKMPALLPVNSSEEKLLPMRNVSMPPMPDSGSKKHKNKGH